MQSAFEVIRALEPATTALFLDFDGTLTPIVDRPDHVRVEDKLIKTLRELSERLQGALAIISGREIVTLDHFLAPHTFAASGVHGLEWRTVGKDVRRLEASDAALAAVVKRLETVTTGHSGLLLEQKLGAVALHYRACPELYEHCRQAVRDAVEGHSGLIVVEGKMVIEVKGHSGNKGTAIETFMLEPPFHSRMPVFVGDDVTDEAGFAAVNALGGISIKVGSGETSAVYRLTDTSEVAVWLDTLVQKYDSETSKKATAV